MIFSHLFRRKHKQDHKDEMLGHWVKFSNTTYKANPDMIERDYDRKIRALNKQLIDCPLYGENFNISEMKEFLLQLIKTNKEFKQLAKDITPLNLKEPTRYDLACLRLDYDTYTNTKIYHFLSLKMVQSMMKFCISELKKQKFVVIEQLKQDIKDIEEEKKLYFK